MMHAGRGAALGTGVALLLLLLGGTSFAPRAQAQTAGQMASFCSPYRHALRLAPHGGGSPIVEAPGANAQSDFCWGAFATLQALSNLQQAGVIQLSVTGHPDARICIAITVERLQLVKAFLQFMDAHPQLANTDFGAALLSAMLQAYPCAPAGR